MKKSKLVLIAIGFIIMALGVVGCGDPGKVINHSIISNSTMEALCPGCVGYATWGGEDRTGSYEVCTIYTYPMAEYNNEDEYHYVLGHEIRHCFEGYFHAEVQGYE